MDTLIGDAQTSHLFTHILAYRSNAPLTEPSSFLIGDAVFGLVAANYGG